MKSIEYGVLVVCGLLMSVHGHGEHPNREGHGMVQPAARRGNQGQTFDMPIAHGVRRGHGSMVGAHRMSKVHMGGEMHHGGFNERRGSRFDHGRRGGQLATGHGRYGHDHRFGHRHHGDERRGRHWYRSFRHRFWERDFIWPSAPVFVTFFSDLIAQAESYGIPQDLLAEVRQLQYRLARLGPRAALSPVLRHRLDEVIGKLMEIAPGIDVQGVFEGGGQQPQPSEPAPGADDQGLVGEGEGEQAQPSEPAPGADDDQGQVEEGDGGQPKPSEPGEPDEN